MIEQHVRPIVQRHLVDPIAKRVGEKMTPTQITWLAGLLGMLVIPALLYQHTWLAVWLLIASGYCDTLDGTLARLTNQSSEWGSVLDIVMDRVVECSVLFGLWAIAPESRSLMTIVMLITTLWCITGFLVVGIFTENTSEKGFHYSPGIMERAEAFIFFSLMILIPDIFNVLATTYTVLVLATAVIRLHEFRDYKRKVCSPNKEKRQDSAKTDRKETKGRYVKS